MRTLKNLFIAWKSRPLFRQYLLWSYRFDFFLLIVAAYFLIGGLALMPYLYSNAVTNAELHRSLTEYRANREAFERLLSKKDGVTAQELDAIVLFDPKNERIRRPQSFRFTSDSGEATRRLLAANPGMLTPAGITSDVLGSLQRKLQDVDILISYVSSELQNSYIRLGNVASSLTTFILVLLPIALMSFCLWNVFHTRDIQFALRHPKFPVLFAQLLALVVIPIAIGGFFEFCSDDTMTFVTESHILDQRSSRFYDFFSKWHQGLAASLISNREVNIFISDPSVILIALICWIAAGLWVVRNIGGGKFLACSTIAALVGVLLQIALSNMGPYSNTLTEAYDLYFFKIQARDSGLTYRLGITLALFGMSFVIGLFVDRYKEYFLCTGFLGALVLSCIITSMIVAGSKASLMSLGGLLLVIVLVTSLVELILRRAMSRFLYDPR